MFQDLSKAYDKVDIQMLKLALKRLKLPDDFITVICNLFTNRKNSIITPNGLTSPYDVLIGIDQGEIISPLLWIIYYDPLFCRLKKLPNKYKVTFEQIHNVNPIEKTLISVEQDIMGYLDDTTMIASSKQDLEQMLTIADSFYKLNNIKINKMKSILITNSSLIIDNKVSVIYGPDLLSIINDELVIRIDFILLIFILF